VTIWNAAMTLRQLNFPRMWNVTSFLKVPASISNINVHQPVSEPYKALRTEVAVNSDQRSASYHLVEVSELTAGDTVSQPTGARKLPHIVNFLFTTYQWPLIRSPDITPCNLFLGDDNFYNTKDALILNYIIFLIEM